MVGLGEFLKRFFAVFLGLYVLFLLPELAQGFGVPFPDFLLPLKLFVAFASTTMLQLLGSPASLEGLTITAGLITFTIVSSCTGVVSFSLLTALLHATPMKRKSFYALLGFFLFVLWNVVRVVLTLSFGGGLARILHDAFWMLSVILVIGAYLLILRREHVYLGEKK
jgi:exosortase/archaeosortase family protein